MASAIGAGTLSAFRASGSKRRRISPKTTPKYSTGVGFLDSKQQSSAPVVKDSEGEMKTAPVASAGSEKGSVAVSAMIVAFGIMMSRILGLVRDVMTAKYFPTDARDAFIAAF